MKETLDRVARFIFNTDRIGDIPVDAWYLARILFVFVFVSAGIALLRWAVPRIDAWGKARYGRKSTAYKLFFDSSVLRIPPLPELLNRRQADWFFGLLFAAVIILGSLVPATWTTENKVGARIVAALALTGSVTYLLFHRKHYKPVPGSQFSIFEFLARDIGMSRERADRLFLRTFPIWAALMIAVTVIAAALADPVMLRLFIFSDAILIPLVLIISGSYFVKGRKLFRSIPEPPHADDVVVLGHARRKRQD